MPPWEPVRQARHGRPGGAPTPLLWERRVKSRVRLGRPTALTAGAFLAESLGGAVDAVLALSERSAGCDRRVRRLVCWKRRLVSVPGTFGSAETRVGSPSFGNYGDVGG